MSKNPKYPNVEAEIAAWKVRTERMGPELNAVEDLLCADLDDADVDALLKLQTESPKTLKRIHRRLEWLQEEAYKLNDGFVAIRTADDDGDLEKLIRCFLINAGYRNNYNF